MNTAPRQPLSIRVRYLGPIFNLDGHLTNRSQNLIFARNGMGKSFLSRAFRYLDLHGQGIDIHNPARNLVSDESIDGNGTFSLFRGTNEIGTLRLDKNGDTFIADVAADTIFHVFSEDFVHEELREREYNIDGTIDNKISIDIGDITIKDKQITLEKKREEEAKATEVLRGKYENSKITELLGKAAIDKRLKDYRELSFERLVNRYVEKPSRPKPSFATILNDLDRLKAIPAEPAYPDLLDLARKDDLELRQIFTLLQKETSPSSVSEYVKNKIDAHHEFYALGVKLVQEDHRSTCPFCEQGITDPRPKAIIDSFIQYFEDEEEKHKSALRKISDKLEQKESELNGIGSRLLRQISRYDALKVFIPSKKESEISDGEIPLSKAREAITLIKELIREKAKNLSVSFILPNVDLAAIIDEVNEVITNNNDNVTYLNKSVKKTDDDRKDLQRKACEVSEREFAIDNWTAFENLRIMRNDIEQNEIELASLEASRPSANARSRVAKTFETLIRVFFGDKYLFDKETFILTRGDYEMIRGSHRTLSDGEKTVVAFCYFVACTHRKVRSDDDYKKLFFVFDDPVTSMSYDFVYSIAETLRYLVISNQGEISINSNKLDGNNCARPKLLILTHSTYLFNILCTNAIVKEDATFTLHTHDGAHTLTPLQKYVAPFRQQLEHVYRVSKGAEPDHGTGNAIRSILEAIGRFCRPDKSTSLQQFINFLAEEENIRIRSVLINSLSHGTYFEETPSPDDLKLASEEAINVVEKYAVGQLELVRPPSTRNPDGG